MASTDAAAAGNARQETANGVNGEQRKRAPSRGQSGNSGRGGGGARSSGGAVKAPTPRAEESKAPRHAEEGDSNVEAPQPVPEPNAEENNAALAAIRAEMEAIEKRVAEINEEVQRAKEVRELQEVAIKDFRAELGPLRSQIAQVSREKDEMIERMKKLNDKIKQQDISATKTKKDLKFKSQEEIEAAIKQLSNRLEHSSVDLKTEKEILRDIQKLNGDKERIKEWNAQVEDVKAQRFAHEDLFLQRQAKGAELKQLHDQEKVIQAKIEAVRNGEGVANGFNANAKITTLLDEKAKLVEKLKEKRAAMQEVHIAFRLKMGEYRDYQKAKMAFERKLERIERQKRQAEAAARTARMQEERKQRDMERKEARRREEQRMIAVAEGCQLFVGGLAIRCDEETIRGHFARFGTISDIIVIRDAETKLSRGFGFVTFTEEARAREAMKETNGKEAKGLCPQHGRIQVKIAEKSKTQQEFEAKRAASRAPKSSATDDASGARAAGKSGGDDAVEAAAGSEDGGDSAPLGGGHGQGLTNGAAGGTTGEDGDEEEVAD